MAGTDPHPPEAEGRQIRLVPLAPGSWWALLGAGVMMLGPLFGFLVGSMIGVDRTTLGMTPIYLFIFLGFMVAGVGLAAMLFGIRRLMHDRRGQSVAEVRP